MSESSTQQAWRQAAADLGIVVVVPAVIDVGSTRLVAVAHLPQFGGHRGMVLLDPDPDGRPTADVTVGLVASGYAWSCRGSLREYERVHVVGLLDDWGWNDPATPAPDWYSGPSLDAGDWWVDEAP